MSLTNTTRVGKPRFDPTDRLLHRFYEPLILLSIIDHTRGSLDIDVLGAESGGLDFKSIWHAFLDGLSWICDYKKGGLTVSSVVAESTPGGSVFWLAARTPKAVPHLNLILAKLESIYNSSQLEIEKTEDFILQGCIQFSKKRINNYRNHLFKEVNAVLGRVPGREGESLFNELRELEKWQYNSYELCSRAYNFENRDALNSIVSSSSVSGEPSDWKEIRHKIGRLGKWHRSVKNFITVAKCRPEHLAGFSVKYLSFPSPTIRPPPDQKTTLESALKRALPQGKDTQVAELHESLMEISRVLGEEVSERFRSKYDPEKWPPKIHAEIVMWEHIYFKKLRLVESAKYVGCSKSSCYCCHLYMQNHPGKPTPRRSHGNLWIQWSPPLPLKSEDENQNKHVKDILNEMNKSVRRDLILQIDSKSPRRPVARDSTTGWSIRDVMQ